MRSLWSDMENSCSLKTHKSNLKEEDLAMKRNSRRNRSVNRSRSDVEIQQLEPRTLLTGTVTVAITAAGDVLVSGDTKDNSVAVTVDSGGIHVTGQSGTSIRYGKTTKTAGTTITAPVPSAIRDLRINMGGGNDTVFFTSNAPVNVRRNVDLDMGPGNDTLLISDNAGINVGNNVQITTGAGNDKVGISTSGGTTNSESNAAALAASGGLINVGKDLTINTGLGNDSVGLADAGKFAGVTNATTLLAVADDTGSVMSQKIRVGRDLKISTGAGNDKVGVLGVEVKRDATLNTGAGRGDVLGVSNLRVGRTLDLIFGDTNALQNVTVAGAVKIRSGIANDRFTLDKIHAGSVDINLQGGNDEIAIGANVVVTGKVKINGGAGKNNNIASLTSLSRASVKNFKGNTVNSMAILDAVLAAIASEGLTT